MVRNFLVAAVVVALAILIGALNFGRTANGLSSVGVNFSSVLVADSTPCGGEVDQGNDQDDEDEDEENDDSDTEEYYA